MNGSERIALNKALCLSWWGLLMAHLIYKKTEESEYMPFLYPITSELNHFVGKRDTLNNEGQEAGESQPRK